MLRHHIGACFAALERCVVDVLADVAPKLLASHEALPLTTAPGPLPAHPIAQALALAPLKIPPCSTSGTHDVLACGAVCRQVNAPGEFCTQYRIIRPFPCACVCPRRSAG